MTDQILTKINNGVLHVILNRPDKKNALTRAMYSDIGDAIEKADSNSSIKVIIIYGNGGVFCAGNDLKDFQDDEWSSNAGSGDFVGSIIKARKPIIAAVHKYAIGIGATMLLNFDLIYAAENTRFQFPFVSLGLVPEFASSINLPQLIGHQRAAEIFFFGDFFTAEEANKAGIVNKIFPEEKLIEEATKLAEKLAEKPPTALMKTKELMKKFKNELVGKYMAEEGAEFARRQVSPEAQEAFSAFFERRKPDFSQFE